MSAVTTPPHEVDEPPKAGMRGTIFVELLAMAQRALGERAVDAILDEGGLTDDGAYTSVGNYSCSELATLVQRISARSGLDQETLHEEFGKWIHAVFVNSHPEFYQEKKCAFDLLESVDREIHVEVRKLYPDSRPPAFHARRLSDTTLEMIYDSPRSLTSFCRGMIAATLAHYREEAVIEATSFSDCPDDRRVRFLITLRPGRS